ncbi:MAG: hypothetical protein Q7T21_07705 [Gallionella sp.]|nr:hypothetical protein [Gallionella sp.]
MIRCRILVLYFASLFSMGLFNLATTPIFEGFDESWHYSAIRQIAYLGKITMRDDSYLDQMVFDYRGPLPYESGSPPFERGPTYGQFVRDRALGDSYIARYRDAVPPGKFELSAETNNLYRQHPALYFAILAPVLKLAEGASLVTQVFVLRLVSYLMALSGVALGLLAVFGRQGSAPAGQRFPLLLGFLAYPFVAPMFFPEFARIGTDSLCLLLVGLLAYLMSRWPASGGRIRWSLSIGVVIGIGLLTKAFFVPIAAAVFMYILTPLVVRRSAEPMPANPLPTLAAIFLPAAAIGGGWYVYSYLVHGTLSGSNMGIWLAQRGGLLANLGSTFSLAVFLRGISATAVTYIWGGTQSLAHLPYALYGPMLVAAACLFAAYCVRLRSIPLRDPLWLTMWLIIFFTAGIFWHAASNMVVGGNGNTPGWYFHILLPFLAPAIGVGLHALLGRSRSGPVVFGFALYAAVFIVVASWFQLALFSGCAVKGDDKHYLFQSKYLCLDNVAMVVDGISLFGYPVLAGLGFCCWVVASILLFVELQRIRQWGSD